MLHKLFFGAAYTEPLHGTDPIAKLEEVEVNGAIHCVLIRGKDKSKPVILVLHGGPGGSDIPYHSQYSKYLEDDFVLVHYDQRGAGKSGYANMYANASRDEREAFKSTLTVNQHVEDVEVIAWWLMNNPELPGAKGGVYLIGGSWGSMLALYAAKKRPDFFKRVLLRGLAVSGNNSEALSTEYLARRMKSLGVAERHTNEVISKGQYPYGNNINKLIFQREWLEAVGGSNYATHELNSVLPTYTLTYNMALAMFLAPEVTLREIMAAKNCMVTSLTQMWHQVEAADVLIDLKSSFEKPLLVAHGRFDNCTSFQLVEPFLTDLKCEDKRLVWFEKSGYVYNLCALLYVYIYANRFSRPYLLMS
jgi:pimeloyl-ACP methyl ester carboxylesterase